MLIQTFQCLPDLCCLKHTWLQLLDKILVYMLSRELLDTTFPPRQLAYQTGVGCFMSTATAVCKLAEVVGLQHFIPKLHFSRSTCGYNGLSLVISF